MQFTGSFEWTNAVLYSSISTDRALFTFRKITLVNTLHNVKIVKTSSSVTIRCQAEPCIGTRGHSNDSPNQLYHIGIDMSAHPYNNPTTINTST